MSRKKKMEWDTEQKIHLQLIKIGIKNQKNKQNVEAHVQLKHGHFFPSPIRFSSTKFSLHFGEKTFCWAPPSFSSLPLSTKHPSKSFPSSFSFSLFFPIFSKIHSTKHNLNLRVLKIKNKNKNKNQNSERKREIIAPLLTGLERFDHRSSTEGCKRLVEANF